MFHEDAFEAWIVAQLKAASAAEEIAGRPGFRVVDSIGAYQIDEENIEEFVRITPACLVGITDENVVDTVDDQGTIRMEDFTLAVNIVGKGAWKFKTASDQVNALARMTKTTLSGLLYAPSDSATDGTAIIRFQDRTTLRIEDGLLIAVQRYLVRTLDKS